MEKKFGLTTILTGLFIGAIVLSVAVFSGFIDLPGSDKQTVQGKVVVWGTIPATYMTQLLETIRTKELTVDYKYKPELTYERDLINAFASGTGPDLFIMPHGKIILHSDKALEIPYSSYSQSQFQNTFISEGNLFLTGTGVMAFPLSVDPMVMYYNKTLIASSFLVDAPQYWDELLIFAPEVNRVDSTGQISVSAVGLGTYGNVLHAKDIFSALVLQNGNPIVGSEPGTSKKISTLHGSVNSMEAAAKALEFYTSFSNFGNENYSWNEALARSRDLFISGDLGLYFGYASEVDDIRRKNPNLDFEIALFPQIRDTKQVATFGQMNGIAISKLSKNPSAAFQVAQSMTSPAFAAPLVSQLFLTPARKDLLRNKPDDAYLTLFYDSAIISRGWFDPDPITTSKIIENMIRDVNSGASGLDEALRRAHADLNSLLGSL